MLKTRVMTALVLLAILYLVVSLNSFPLFVAVTTLFFSAAAWESFRLFDSRHPIIGTIIWSGAFLFAVTNGVPASANMLLVLCVAIWLLRLAPMLATGLPPREGIRNRFLNSLYGIAVFGCFIAIVRLYSSHSGLYLISVMAIVWIADIGAYFGGKALGKHKLAPSISPGKTWEGAIAGWVLVLVLSAATTATPWLMDTFSARLQAKWGWLGFVSAMTIIVAASVVGDLFESQLKRRVSMKDSSHLLPGHGGVLDRIDALIPVLPLVTLVDFFL